MIEEQEPAAAREAGVVARPAARSEKARTESEILRIIIFLLNRQKVILRAEPVKSAVVSSI